jgi:hypothetical protein
VGILVFFLFLEGSRNAPIDTHTFLLEHSLLEHFCW